MILSHLHVMFAYGVDRFTSGIGSFRFEPSWVLNLNPCKETGQ